MNMLRQFIGRIRLQLRGKNHIVGWSMTPEEAIAFFQRQGKTVLTFFGYSVKYNDEEGMLKIVRDVLSQYRPEKTLVNMGATKSGMGAAYPLIKSLGFITAGIVSTEALAYPEDISEAVEHVCFIKDNQWGGKLPNSNQPSPVVSYPDRGPWGDASYRRNCSGYLVKDLILSFGCQSVFDPAEGSGTVRDVVAGINHFLRRDIAYEGRDLRDGWDILTGQLPEGQFDLVWYHPPYWDIVRYSDDPNDLSNCQSLEEFELKLNRSVERLFQTVKPGGIMAVLIGDKRNEGRYYQLFRSLLFNRNIDELKALIIKVQHNCSSNYRIYNMRNPFLIPIKHEYCLVFQKQPAPAPCFQENTEHGGDRKCK